MHPNKFPTPKTLNLDEMWKLYRLWSKKDMTGREMQEIFDFLFPKKDFTSYELTDVMQILVFGVDAVGLLKFADFIKGLVNG